MIMEAPLSETVEHGSAESATSKSTLKVPKFIHRTTPSDYPTGSSSNNEKKQQQELSDGNMNLIDATARYPPSASLNKENYVRTRQLAGRHRGPTQDYLQPSNSKTIPLISSRSSLKPNQLPATGTGAIAHGCLLIPVFLAAWWYWTRRTYRRVVSKLIKSTPEPFDNDEASRSSSVAYSQWEDMVQEVDVEPTHSPSLRLVKWFKAGDLEQQITQDKLRLVTKRIVHGTRSRSLSSTDYIQEDMAELSTLSTKPTCVQYGSRTQNLDTRTNVEPSEENEPGEPHASFYQTEQQTSPRSMEWESLQTVHGSDLAPYTVIQHQQVGEVA